MQYKVQTFWYLAVLTFPDFLILLAIAILEITDKDETFLL